MDRDFRNPEDVARAGPERVGQALVKELRRGVSEKPFVMRLRYQYHGGHVAPMLFIGAMSRAWSDYINGNARANDMVTGVCSVEFGDVGRQRIRLRVRGGRGAGDGNLLELNRYLRGHNAEALFESDDGERPTPSAPSSVPPALAGRATAPPVPAGEPEEVVAAPPPAEPEAETAAADEVTEQAPPPAAAPPAEAAPTQAPEPAPAFDFAGEARTLKAQFEVFRESPDEAGLVALEAGVARFREAQAAADAPVNEKVVAFVDKLDALLKAKGRAFLASRAG